MQTYYTQLASVVQFFWLNLYCHIGRLLLCAAVCPSAAAVSFCAVVTDSPKTKTLLGKTEAAVTRPCNKPNIQKFRFRSLRGHVFPFCLFSFFLSLPREVRGQFRTNLPLTSHSFPSKASRGCSISITISNHPK